MMHCGPNQCCKMRDDLTTSSIREEHAVDGRSRRAPSISLTRSTDSQRSQILKGLGVLLADHG